MPCLYIGTMSDRENEIISTVSYIQGKVGFREPPFSLQAFFEAFPHYQLEAARLPRGFHGEILVKGEIHTARVFLDLPALVLAPRHPLAFIPPFAPDRNPGDGFRLDPDADDLPPDGCGGL